jgi:hypothetical protein
LLLVFLRLCSCVCGDTCCIAHTHILCYSQASIVGSDDLMLFLPLLHCLPLLVLLLLQGRLWTQWAT